MKDSRFLKRWPAWPWIAALLWAATVLPRAADHPQWGQDFSRNMVSEERNLPDSFDIATGKNL
jgi:hypothetical protein